MRRMQIAFNKIATHFWCCTRLWWWQIDYSNHYFMHTQYIANGTLYGMCVSVRRWILNTFRIKTVWQYKTKFVCHIYSLNTWNTLFMGYGVSSNYFWNWKLFVLLKMIYIGHIWPQFYLAKQLPLSPPSPRLPFCIRQKKYCDTKVRLWSALICYR